MKSKSRFCMVVTFVVIGCLVAGQLAGAAYASETDVATSGVSDPEDQHPEQAAPDDPETPVASSGTTTDDPEDTENETQDPEEAPTVAAAPSSLLAAPFAGIATFAADGTAVAKFVADNHVVMLRADGRLLVWGDNTYGQLGLGQGAATTVYTPVENTFFADKKIRDIAVCEDATFVLLNNGELYSFGKGLNGRLGSGSTSNIYTPTLVTGSASLRFVKLYPGREFVIAATDDNKLYAWGRNNYGQIGNGTKADVLSPVKIMDNADIKHLDVGDDYALLIKQDNTFWDWGNNDRGQFPVDGEFVVSNFEFTTPIKTTANHSSWLLYSWVSTPYPTTNYPAAGDVHLHTNTRVDSTIPTREIWGQLEGTYPHVYTSATAANHVSRLDDSTITHTGSASPSGYDGEKSVYVDDEGCITGHWASRSWSATREVNSNTRTINLTTKVSWTESPGSINFYNAEDVSRITNLQTGRSHGYLTYDGKVYSWGDSTLRQQSSDYVTSGLLSKANIINNFITTLNNSEGFSALTVAKDTNYITSGTGNVYVWGSNQSGKAGTGAGSSYIETPTAIHGLNGKSIAKIVPGRNTTYYISHTGDVYVTGDNYYGQSGLGEAYADESKITTPEKIETFKFSDTATPPDPPDAINTPDEVEAGTTIEIHWPEVSSATEYELVRYVTPKNNGMMSFAATSSEVVYSGDQSMCTDIAQNTWDYVKYGVRAVNFIGDKSAEVTSSNINVLETSGNGGDNNNNNNNNNGGNISQDYLDSLKDLINSMNDSQQKILLAALKSSGGTDSTINVNNPDISKELMTALLTLASNNVGEVVHDTIQPFTAVYNQGATQQELLDIFEKIATWQPPTTGNKNDDLITALLLKLIEDKPVASNTMPVFFQMPGRSVPKTANIVVSILILVAVVALVVVNFVIPDAEEQG